MKIQILNSTRGTLLANRADVADTDQKRYIGLSNRVGLAPGEGLWIVPCESIQTHTMRFPIDVVFLDDQYAVLDILANVLPGGTATRDGAASVLELPTGTLDQTMTAAGDQLQLAQIQETAQPRNVFPGCMGILNLLEQYGLVQTGTSVAVGTLAEHAQKVHGVLQGVRR